MLSAAYIRKLLPVATDLSAAEISAHIPRALRDASLFSARNVYAGLISETQSDLARALEGGMSAAQARGLMKLRLRKLGYAPASEGKGSLTDLSSDARTSLVVSHQMQRASSYAKWRQDQDPAILDAFPGQEMFRAGAPKVPRNWAARWDAARAALGPATSATPAAAGFFALKNDPIWSAISRFGSPFPPFDYNSSMRVRNVGRRRCRELGLLADDGLAKKLLQPARDPMDGNVTSSSASGMDPRLVKAWADSFNGRARVYAGRDGLPRVAVAPPADTAAQIVAAAQDGAKASAAFGFPSADGRRAIEAATGKPLRPEAAFHLSADEARHALKHPEITPGDIKDLPSLVSGRGSWRASTDQEKGNWRGDAVTFVSDSGKTACFRITAGQKDPRLTLITMYGNKKIPARTLTP